MTIKEYMGLYFIAYRPFGRRHLNDNEINFLFGANHPALGTDLLIFVYGGTLAISSEYELLSQYHYLQVTICFIKVSLCRNFLPFNVIFSYTKTKTLRQVEWSKSILS